MQAAPKRDVWRGAAGFHEQGRYIHPVGPLASQGFRHVGQVWGSYRQGGMENDTLDPEDPMPGAQQDDLQAPDRTGESHAAGQVPVPHGAEASWLHVVAGRIQRQVAVRRSVLPVGHHAAAARRGRHPQHVGHLQDVLAAQDK